MTGFAERRGASELARAVADHRWAAVQRHLALREHTRVLRQLHQSLINAEVRSTRRALLRALRRRGGAVAFLDDDFLAVADAPAVYEAVLDAAVTWGGAARADLQLYDSGAAVLRMAAQRGFAPDFLAFFATVDAGQATACAKALATRAPVLIDDVSRSPIFAGQPSLDAMIGAGSRSVHSYPLLAPHGAVLGVLSFHAPTPLQRSGEAEVVARCAAEVVGQSA